MRKLFEWLCSAVVAAAVVVFWLCAFYVGAQAVCK